MADGFVSGWLKRIGLRKRNSKRLNCWFCNGNFEIKCEEENHWICPGCDQYNGFDEDGDYNRPIQDVFADVPENASNFCLNPNSPTQVVSSILCHSCNQNQVLKVRQLASFVPFEETFYDEEISHYHRYLEHLYKLCLDCQVKVRGHLHKLNKRLDLESRRDCQNTESDESYHSLPSSTSRKFQPPRRSILSSVLLSISCVISVSLALLQLRYLLESQCRTGGGFCHIIYSYLDGLLYTIPVKNVTHLEQCLIYAGASFCILGLFTVGKYSLLVIDTLHIVLWLTSLLVWLALPQVPLSGSASWPPVSIATKFGLCLAISLASIVCILKQRRKRNISNLRVLIKPVVSEGSECSYSESEMYSRRQIDKSSKPAFRKNVVESSSLSSLSSSSFVGDADNLFVPISSSPIPGPPSVSHSPTAFESVSSLNLSKDKTRPADSEDVRQNLETFSLGLGKKSGSSSSSIWSLPSIVASSPCPSPDTTQKPSHKPSSHRRLLSPSRLGFLSNDSLVENAGAFTSYQPMMPSDASKWRDSHASQSHPQGQTNYQVNFVSSGHHAQTLRDSPSQTTSCIELCDSSTSLDYRGQLKGMTAVSSLSPLREKGFDIPDCSATFDDGAQVKESKRQLRRSNRIAMQGRVIKPWPLKKSLSHNMVYDRRRQEMAGHLMESEWKAGPVVDETKQAELRPFAFSSYIPGRAFKETASVTKSAGYAAFPDSVMDNAGHVRRRMSRKVDEYSDNEEDGEEEQLHERTWRSGRRNRSSSFSRLKDSWFTWMLLLFGVLIGISLASNAFLLWTVINKPS